MTVESPKEVPGFRVLRAIRRIIRRVSAHSRRVAGETGVSLPQMLVMRAIDAESSDEVTGALVAERVHLSRSTVSTLVDKLARAGLVGRVRGERDRRQVHLSLTEAGHARLREMPSPLEDRFLSRLAALDAGEREQIVAALERVVELMDAEEVDASPHLMPGDQRLVSMVPKHTPVG